MPPVPKPRSDEVEFQAALQAEDELGMVVRAHIRIELCLNELISLLAVDQTYIDKMSLEYAQKVNLAVGLGLLPGYAPPLLVMGSLRNAFAHRAEAALGRQEVNNLYKAMPADDRVIANQAYERTKKQLKTTNMPPFRSLPPKDQFIFIAVGLRAALMFAVEEAKAKKSAASQETPIK